MPAYKCAFPLKKKRYPIGLTEKRAEVRKGDAQSDQESFDGWAVLTARRRNPTAYDPVAP